MLECVINISEGRDLDRVERIAASAGTALLDVHSDPHHNRSVLTVVGEDAAKGIAAAAVSELDLQHHEGAHPRLGVVDVVPFVALDPTPEADACAARDRFAEWLAGSHGVPCFLYGSERTLPDVRRGAFANLSPDHGPPAPHPTAGATAVGQRGVLVAYNVMLEETDLAVARRIASAVRGPAIRALGLAVGPDVQVSMNLIDPMRTGPDRAFDLVAALARDEGSGVRSAELVGLVPHAVLEAIPQARWAELDLDPQRTIEARLSRLG